MSNGGSATRAARAWFFMSSYMPFSHWVSSLPSVKASCTPSLAAIAEIQAAIVELRDYQPVIGVVAGSVGCFGGMSIAAGLCSYLVVTREARVGLNGPQVIEQEAGLDEYDSRDRPFIWSLTGGEQRYASGLVDAYVADDTDAIRAQLHELFALGKPLQPRSRRHAWYLQRLADVDTRTQLDADAVRRAAWMVLAVVAPLLAGQLDDLWFFLLIYPMVGLTLILISALDQRAGRQRESQQRLTISEERERVARDVHDVLGHSLTVVTVKSELAERLVDVDPERAKAEMAEVRSISRQALAEIRATVAGLRVARLTDELAAAEQALTGAGMRLEVRGSPEEVDPRHRIVLAWAVREAVTNVVRHSGARLCQITLGQDRLSVRDDGRGVSGRREGNGIGGLRERVEQQGGSVSLGPGAPGTGDGARGSGTLLEVRLGGADDTGETTAKVAT